MVDMDSYVSSLENVRMDWYGYEVIGMVTESGVCFTVPCTQRTKFCPLLGMTRSQ